MLFSVLFPEKLRIWENSQISGAGNSTGAQGGVQQVEASTLAKENGLPPSRWRQRRLEFGEYGEATFLRTPVSHRRNSRGGAQGGVLQVEVSTMAKEEGLPPSRRGPRQGPRRLECGEAGESTFLNTPVNHRRKMRSRGGAQEEVLQVEASTTKLRTGLPLLPKRLGTGNWRLADATNYCCRVLFLLGVGTEEGTGASATVPDCGATWC